MARLPRRAPGGIAPPTPTPQLRAVRWVACALAQLQLWLYQPGSGPPLRWSQSGVMLGLLAGFVLLDRIAAWSARGDERRRSCAGVALLAGDTLVCLAITAVFAEDRGAALWAALVLPVLEGAYRYQLRGAVAVWAASGAGYIAIDRLTPGTPLALDSITYRLGIPLIVALTAGQLARDLGRQVAAHAEERRRSHRRAELLHIVATSARSMASPDPNVVFTVVVDAAVSIGFDAAALCVLDPGAATYTIAHARGLPPGLTLRPGLVDEGLVGRARRERGTVVEGDYAAWDSGVPALRAAGFHSALATPIWVSGEIVAVLGACRREIVGVSDDEVEGAELLAAHAGAALVQASRSAERLIYEDRLEHQAFHDALTGLPNRRRFLDQLERALVRARRAESTCAVAFLDLDRFKTVNDSLGHAAGDELLIGVGNRLKHAVRASDTVARLGGDEFAVLLEDVDPADARMVAGAVLSSLVSPLPVAGRELDVAASVGLALAVGGRTSATDLLREADLAMYRAKERGRGRVEVYEEAMEARALRRLELESALRRAPAAGELSLRYQPIIALRPEGHENVRGAGSMVAVEALLRWQHPVLGEVLPTEFVGLAEDTGAIGDIGRWALRAACVQARAWREIQPALVVNVNLAPAQLRDRRLPGEVRRTLAETGLPPSALVLEVTESAVGGDAEAAAGVVAELSALGVALAVDDFGTGHSSLARVKDLPIGIVKVDRVFVAGVASSSADRAIIRSIVSLAHDLGLSVTAEGIETPEQLESVRTLGVDSAQGFHLGEPLDPDAISLLLRAAAHLHPRQALIN